jgi:BirA family transcriptional regulator, biotin operon repressor / biotin---[acetyl-CoA-carboxylase] ligase
LSGLSLAASVGIARALAECGLSAVEGLRVKWPNDLLCQRAKLCGILIEAQGDMLGPTTVVVGVGLNYRLNLQARASIGQAATAYVDCAGEKSVGRNSLVGSVLAHLGAALAAFAEDGFSAFRDEWLQHHAHTGQAIRYTEAGQTYIGTAMGVDKRGALIVDAGGGTRVLTSAEVVSV